MLAIFASSYFWPIFGLSERRHPRCSKQLVVRYLVGVALGRGCSRIVNIMKMGGGDALPRCVRSGWYNCRGRFFS